MVIWLSHKADGIVFVVEGISRRQFLRLGTVAATAALFKLTAGDAVLAACQEAGRSAGLPLAADPNGIRCASITFSAADFQKAMPSGLAVRADRLALAGQQFGTLAAAPVEAPVAFAHLGAYWHGSVPPGAEVALQVRTSADGANWSAWQDLRAETLGREVKGGAVFGNLASVPDDRYLARFAQFTIVLRASPSAREALPTLASLTLVFIDASGGPSGANLAERVCVTSLDRPQVEPGARPAMVSRTDWGCPDGQTSPKWLPQYRPVSHIVIHHTATSNTSSNWPSVVRTVWNYHAKTCDWGDVGYNFLIDPTGVIYEGRAGGDDVSAAHVYGFNDGTMGIGCIGTYSSTDIPAPMRSALLSLMAWKCAQRGIVAGGSANIAGYEECKTVTVNQPCLTGHRDFPGHNSGSPNSCNVYGSTACPGDRLEAAIPGLRSELGRDTAAPIAAIGALAPFAPSPFALTWSARDDRGIRCYDVEYKVGAGGAWAPVPNKTQTTETSAQYAGSDGLSYAFRCRATDISNNVGPWSAEAGTTVDITAPTCQWLSSSHTDQHNWFVLNWTATDAVSGVDNYDVEMSTNGGASWTSYMSGARTPVLLYVGQAGSSYQFRFRARDRAGNTSGWSTSINVVAGSDTSGLSQVRLPIVAR